MTKVLRKTCLTQHDKLTCSYSLMIMHDASHSQGAEVRSRSDARPHAPFKL